MFKAIKKKIKQNKLNKEIKLDKSKDKPEKFPLQLSPNEKTYLQNVFSCIGGGSI